MAFGKFFTIMMLVSLFYSLSINLIIYTLPDDTARGVIGNEKALADNINTQDIGGKVEDTFTDIRTRFPLYDLAVMAFYTGQFLLDLVINFVLAIPQMVMIFVNGIFMILPIDSTIQMMVTGFIYVAFSVVYIMQLISMASQLFTQTGTGGFE